MKKKFMSKLIVLIMIVTTVLSFSSVTFADSLTAEQRAMRDKFGKANAFEMTISEMCLAVGDYLMEYMTFLLGEEVTVERIIFNKVDALNANFFNNSINPSGAPASKFVRAAINEWYSLLGQIVIIVFLMALAAVGIMTMLGGPGKKAKAQELFVKWIIGIAIYYFFPYVMKYAFNLNEAIIQMIQSTFNGGNELVNSYIGELSDLKHADLEFRSPQYVTQSTYILMLGSEEATSAYINRLETYESKGDIMRMMRAMAGITARMLYVILWFIMLGQLIIFVFIYYKRYLMIAFLIAIFPITLFEYIIGSIVTGRQSAISGWSKEFFVNVFLQSIHAVIYGIITGVIMNQLLNVMQTGNSADINWFLMIVGVNFVFTGEKTLREIINAMATESVKTGDDVMKSAKGGMNKVKGAVGGVAGKMMKK